MHVAVLLLAAGRRKRYLTLMQTSMVEAFFVRLHEDEAISCLGRVYPEQGESVSDNGVVHCIPE
jgi:hypothetical protein